MSRPGSGVAPRGFALGEEGEDVSGLKSALPLLVPLVVAAAFVLALSGALPYKIYVVHTGSMSPAITSRSAVIVHEHEYRLGQPISFYEHGEVITHRLVRINADGSVNTKGDANATIDPWQVPANAIIGGVIAAPPEVGYWLTYLKNPAGLASILLSVLACWQIWSFSGRRGGRPEAVA